MAAVMSLGRMPAAFAAARDSRASSLNKSFGGAPVIPSCQHLIFQVWIATDKSSQSACGIYGREHNSL